MDGDRACERATPHPKRSDRMELKITNFIVNNQQEYLENVTHILFHVNDNDSREVDLLLLCMHCGYRNTAWIHNDIVIR